MSGQFGTSRGRWTWVLLAALLSLPVAAQDETGGAPAEEAAPVEEAAPWRIYLGLDMDRPTLSLSDPALRARFGAQELDSTMLRARAGLRLFEFIGVELQVGSGSEDGSEPGTFDIARYSGLFVVPTGVLFDVVEVAGLFGLTRTEAERGNASETFDGQAYGVNIEFPLRLMVDSLPDLRLGIGYLVHDHNNRHRIYGAHAGLRYDFNL